MELPVTLCVYLMMPQRLASSSLAPSGGALPRLPERPGREKVLVLCHTLVFPPRPDDACPFLA